MKDLFQKVQNLTIDDIYNERANRAKESLLNFTLFTKKNYDANWHHVNLMNKLDEMKQGKVKRLMVFMPPRHGKSEIVSRRFPAYMLGNNPNMEIIGTSYSASLASAMNRDIQRIIDSEEYKTIFPETSLSGSNVRASSKGSYLRNSDEFEIVGYNGSYKSAGIGGGITGHGGDLVIIDDPVKNRAEAESKTYRDKVFDWYASTLYTRLEKDARVLITLTRWHEDDLAGKLLKLAKENPNAEQWEIISYPALFESENVNIDPTDPRENGQALWPAKYDKSTLKTMKTTVGSYEWSALYQQRPSPSTGGVVNRDWFNYYDVAPARFDEIIQSWDLAFKDSNTSDYVVGQVWGRVGANKYLLDQVRGRFGFTQTIRMIKSLSAKWPRAKAKYIEDKANGPAVINTLRGEISGLIPVNPEGSKETRAYAVSPQIEAGNVYIPRKAHWVEDYVEEWVTFPNGLHDDQVDTTTQALLKLNKRTNGAKVTARSY